MLNMLINQNGVCFQNCYVYSKSLQQPKYKFLEKVLEGEKQMGCYFFKDSENVLPPIHVKPNSVIIFDDVATENQDIIRDYFAMGRHNGVDSFYLCQSYARIPKHLIRDNANLIILFKQDALNMRHVYDDHVVTDMAWDKFQNMCEACWKTHKYGCLVICTDCPLSNGRYRRGLDEFIKICNKQ